MFFTSSFIVDMLLLCIMALFGLHIMIEKKRGHWMLIDPFNAFWGGVFVCYVLQPIAYFEHLNSDYGTPLLVKTLANIIWALIWLIVGYQWKWGPKLGEKLPRMPSQVRPYILTAAGWTVVMLGFAGYAVLISTSGSFSAWISTGRGGTDWKNLSGYLAVLEYFLPAGITILLFRVELIKCGAFMRGIVWFMAVTQWLWLVYLGSRSRTIMFLGTIAAAIYLPRRKNPSWVLAATAGAFLFLLTNFQAQYRGQFTNLSFNLDQLNFQQVLSSILPAKLGGSMDNGGNKPLGELEFNCTAAIVELVPSHAPYNYGYTLLELVTRPIPHALWPGKIYPQLEAQTQIMEERRLSGFWITTSDGRYLGGPALTFVGYWYHAGGTLALCIAGLLTGTGFRALRSVYDRDPGNVGDVIMYSLLLPIGFYEAVSNPLSWMFYLPLVVIPVYFFLRTSRAQFDPDLPSVGASLEPG